jgi:phosphatidylserine decarboxylase
MITWRLLKYLPRRKLSQIVGLITRIQWPAPLNQWLLEYFVKTYQINMAEAELELTQYKTLNHLFTRKLKAGVRPLAASFCVAPADSRITQFGKIENGTLIQAKDITYRLAEFLGSPEKATRFEGGTFIVYYLCPTDYHRVHSPVEGVIKDIQKLGLDLWPVHDECVSEVKDLFITNERVVVSISTQLGPVETVFVGATNVGSIELFKALNSEVQKGEELGMFQFGSTVVMIYPKSIKVDIAKIKSEPVLMGQELKQIQSQF